MSIIGHFVRASAIAGCVMVSSAPAVADNWDNVIAAAKKEGTVTVYTTGLAAEFHKLIAASFTKKYGIPVNLLDLRASEIRERVRIEQSTGNQIGDMIQLSPSTLGEMRKERTIDTLPPIPNERNFLPGFSRTEISIPSHGYGFGILINTNLVKPGDRPKSWRDLLDPKWQGKILSDDFRAAGGGQVFFEVMYDAFGETFHRELAKQKLVFSRELGSSKRRVAMGEYPLRIPQHLVTFHSLKGLPVEFIEPSEGLVFIQFNSSILQNARHPNAARLLINHYLEVESQQIIEEYSLMKTIDTGGGDASKGKSVFKVFGTTKPGYLDEMLKLAKEIYK
ncbi:MAG: extracellular solute-binding protein [Bradyrhizobiaceae bacterium]|nr:extracellular solute-binding protein [Bradyrhizobiaceae bacterium]